MRFPKLSRKIILSVSLVLLAQLSQAQSSKPHPPAVPGTDPDTSEKVLLTEPDPAAKKAAQEKIDQHTKPHSPTTLPPNTVQAAPSPKPVPVPPPERNSRFLRGEKSFFIMGNYSHLDLLLPAKTGATIGWNTSSANDWEFEYLKGTIKPPFFEDIGSMTDERMSLIRRSFFSSNSFNFFYGFAYHDFKVKLGDELLNRLSAGVYPDLTMLRVASWGAVIGIGNRWMIDPGLTLGIDWISWSQPLISAKKEAPFLDYVTNKQDKDDVEKAMGFLQYFPRFVLFKLSVGWSF